MRGNVIAFDRDTNTGAIGGHDGNRYDFVRLEWRSPGVPGRGAVVDFIRFHITMSSFSLNWPYVFNLADAAIVAGVAALLYESIFRGRAAKVPGSAP